MFAKKGIRLRVLISLVILFIIICSVSISWLISMHTYKKSLTENYLESNYNYSKKLTESIEFQLDYMQKNIIALGDITGNGKMTQTELDTWYDANYNQFNSIFTTDSSGIVKLLSPETIQFNRGKVVTRGTQLKTNTFKKALADKVPQISEPYFGTSGQLITLISAPIFDQQTNEFEGVIGGTIYMETANVLKKLLEAHGYEDDSYVYAVDQSGKIIYHPDEKRIGDNVSNDKVVKHVISGKSGSDISINEEGAEFFSGYSNVKNTGWGIIAQTPTSILNESISDLYWRLILLSIPFLLLILILGSFFVSFITKPLDVLVDFSESSAKGPSNFKYVENLNINSPIYEIRQLYDQMIDHVRMLNQQAKMDGLTELANRRTFNFIIELWMAENISFSLIMLDIDHFKKVNDIHGHLTGDEVLIYLAKELSDQFSIDDLCFRYGGEEFGVLVKNTDEEATWALAEQLRQKIADTVSPSGEAITISLGVTEARQEDAHYEEIFRRADAALYYSKQAGRNQTTIFNDDVHDMDK